MNSVMLCMRSGSSVDRAPTQCLGGHGFDGDSDFLLVPCLCHVDHIHLSHLDIDDTHSKVLEKGVCHYMSRLLKDLMIFINKWSSF